MTCTCVSLASDFTTQLLLSLQFDKCSFLLRLVWIKYTNVLYINISFINMNALAWEHIFQLVLGYSLSVSTISFRVDTGKRDITISEQQYCICICLFVFTLCLLVHYSKVVVLFKLDNKYVYNLQLYTTTINNNEYYIVLNQFIVVYNNN